MIPRTALRWQGVAQADHGSGADAVEELACLGRRQNRGLAASHGIFGAAHGGGLINGQDMATHQPVRHPQPEHPQGGSRPVMARLQCASRSMTHRSTDSWLKRQSEPTLNAGILDLRRSR